jgi:hypothetical protein
MAKKQHKIYRDPYLGVYADSIQRQVTELQRCVLRLEFLSRKRQLQLADRIADVQRRLETGI